MSARILILTAGFGEGHNAAARALTTACNAEGGPDTALMVDAFALAAPQLNRLLRRAYLGLVNHAPGAWSAVYRWLDLSPVAPRLMHMLARERRALRQVVSRERPAVLCSTYPVYGFMLEGLVDARGKPLPHFSVVTDSISINSLWWRGRCDAWFVPNEDSAGVMRQNGVPDHQLQVLGFPVGLGFAQAPGASSPPDLRSGARPRVLYIINSDRGQAVATARRLLREIAWEVTCTVGRNEALREELTRLAERRPVPARVLGWTDEIPALLRTHHLVVSKAGGATTQEAIAAGCPMVVNQVVPGQEEGNYELLRRHGIGTLAETPDAVIAALGRAFQNDGAVWQDWRRALIPLSRPRAAHDIAAKLCAWAAEPEPIPLPLRPCAGNATSLRASA